MRLFKIKITDLDGLDTWACAAFRTVRAQEFLRTPDEDQAEVYGPLQARELAGRYLAEVGAVRGVLLEEVDVDAQGVVMYTHRKVGSFVLPIASAECARRLDKTLGAKAVFQAPTVLIAEPATAAGVTPVSYILDPEPAGCVCAGKGWVPEVDADGYSTGREQFCTCPAADRARKVPA